MLCAGRRTSAAWNACTRCRQDTRYRCKPGFCRQSRTRGLLAHTSAPDVIDSAPATPEKQSLSPVQSWGLREPRPPVIDYRCPARPAGDAWHWRANSPSVQSACLLASCHARQTGQPVHQIRAVSIHWQNCVIRTGNRSGHGITENALDTQRPDQPAIRREDSMLCRQHRAVAGTVDQPSQKA